MTASPPPASNAGTAIDGHGFEVPARTGPGPSGLTPDEERLADRFVAWVRKRYGVPSFPADLSVTAAPQFEPEVERTGDQFVAWVRARFGLPDWPAEGDRSRT